MNDILARRARRATVGIALSAALVAGIAPATAIAAETSSPTGAVALQTEDAAAAKEKAYAAMQEALKNLEAAKDAASPEKIAEIDDDIAAFQELYDMVVAEAAKQREPLPAMQANVDAAQAKYDEAHNRTSGLQAELDKALEVLGGEEPSTAIRCLTCNRQRRPTKLHQAGELEQRQASKYDRRQAREHGRHSTERNRTRSSRRRRPRNNRHSHTPHQELKIDARAFCLHQSTSPETKRGPFPQPRETSLFNCKNSSNSTAAS